MRVNYKGKMRIQNIGYLPVINNLKKYSEQTNNIAVKPAENNHNTGLNNIFYYPVNFSSKKRTFSSESNSSKVLLQPIFFAA